MWSVAIACQSFRIHYQISAELSLPAKLRTLVAKVFQLPPLKLFTAQGECFHVQIFQLFDIPFSVGDLNKQPKVTVSNALKIFFTFFNKVVNLNFKFREVKNNCRENNFINSTSNLLVFLLKSFDCYLT